MRTLRTTVLPAPTAAAAARKPRISGAFHGAIARTTPKGSLMTIACASGSLTTGTVPDKTPLATVAAHPSAIAIASRTLICSQRAVHVISCCIKVWISSVLSRRSCHILQLHILTFQYYGLTCAKLLNSLCRSAGCESFQEVNALAHDSTAFTHNSGVAPTAEIPWLFALSGLGWNKGAGKMSIGAICSPLMRSGIVEIIVNCKDNT